MIKLLATTILSLSILGGGDPYLFSKQKMKLRMKYISKLRQKT